MLIRIKKNIHILQQNFYNEDNRYLKWGKRNILKVFSYFDILLYLMNLINLIIKNKYFLLINIIYLLLFFFEYFKSKREQVKIPLKITSRIKRIFITCFIVYIIPLIIYLCNNDKYLFCFILSFMICFNYFIIFLVNIIDYPIEKIVYYYYKKKAMDKLGNYSDMEVIGITGSYGKTSSKNILNDILNVKFNAITTPKNFNTKYGLIITINNYLDKFNDIFIAEMGAFRLGSINDLCDLVHPKYGIITNIGLAHLDSFGSQENIQRGKFELVESLPSDGIAILNMDDIYQVNYKIKNKCKKIWIAIDNIDSDIRATDILMDESGMKFQVTFKGDKDNYPFETRLLGRYNIYNILSAIALGKLKGMSISELQLGVKIIKTIPHRLELKKINDKIIIDDAYNANPLGSKMALDVLGLMKGTRIVISPGMIELGDKQDELNRQFGEYMAQVAHYVILVGKKQTKPIYDGLMQKKYDKEKIFVINDVKEAFKIIDNIMVEDIKFVLLENDLPDIFNED